MSLCLPYLFSLVFVSCFMPMTMRPIHVHVIKGDAHAKFTIDPVELVHNDGMKQSELKLVESIIEENQEVIAEHWNKFFNKTK